MALDMCDSTNFPLHDQNMKNRHRKSSDTTIHFKPFLQSLVVLPQAKLKMFCLLSAVPYGDQPSESGTLGRHVVFKPQYRMDIFIFLLKKQHCTYYYTITQVSILLCVNDREKSTLAYFSVFVLSVGKSPFQTFFPGRMRKGILYTVCE